MQRRSLVVLALFTLSIVFSGFPLPLFTPLAHAVEFCNGYEATVTGTDNADTLEGTSGDDVIAGLGGHDTINGNGGDDIVCGGTGNDTITTGDGDDYVNGGDGNDTIDAGDGDNDVDGSKGNDTITTGNGTDIVDGNDGNDTIYAGNGNDLLKGDSGNDKLYGEGGDDILSETSGNNELYGGNGYDSLKAGDNNDSLDGGDDIDACNGGTGSNTYANCEGEGDETGVIVIRKETIPDGDDQEFTFSGDIEFEGGLSDGEETWFDLFASGGGDGTYYEITEDNLEDWQLTGLTCYNPEGSTSVDLEDRSVSVDLDPGELIICTFTNTKAASVTIVKETEGGDDEFFFEGPEEEDEFSIETEEGSGDETFILYPDEEGTSYTFSEEVSEGWELSDISCEDIDMEEDENSVSFELEPGDEVTCTFTNVEQGTLRIIKELVDEGEEDEGTLEFSVDIGEVGSYTIEIDSGEGEGSVDVQLAPGEYEVTEEELPEDWMLVSNGCDEVEVLPGQMTECTIVNKKKSRIIIHKTAIGDSGTFSFSGLGEEDIEVEADEESEEGSNQYSGESFFDVFVDIEGESFSVSEVLPEETLWIQTQPEENCTIENLLPGQSQTCEFTNVKKATIVVVKETTGGDGTFTVSSSNEDIGSFEMTTEEGEAELTFTILLEEDTEISFEEVDLPDEWVGSPDSCTIEVGPGDTAICSLGNIKKARLIVEKDTIGGDGTFSFETDGFTAQECDEEEECDENAFSLETESNHAETFFDIFVDGESLEVSVEELEQEGWQIVGDSSCTVSLEPGEVQTCTFTNAKAARLTVSKITLDGTGTFHFTGIGPEEGFDLTTESPEVAVESFFDVFVDIEEGTLFTIEEDAQEGWQTDEPCTVTLHPGDEEACVFTNTFIPPEPEEEDDEENNDDEQSPDEDQSGGGSGNGSRAARAKATFLAGFHGVGNLPPGAFGAGPEVPLSEDEIQFVCSMQRTLPPIPPLSLVEALGAFMAELMGRDPAFIIEQLQDPFLCADINAALNTLHKTIVALSLSSFPLGSDGIPVSRNMTWNACIRDQVTLDIIRNNTDRDDDGRPRTCADYHTSGLWRHPDLGIYFTFQRSPLKVELPPGYVFLEPNTEG